MAPIRVGMVGLSAKGDLPVPGAWGVITYLTTLTAHPAYEITALCNTSVESAQRAIKMHKLPASTKAYGNIQDLANDAEIDLIIISVNITKHYELMKPPLLKKKNVFVEWPLGATTREAEEVTDLAKENGLSTIVGLQARADPLVLKLKQIIDNGEIGQVKSSHVVANFGGLPPFWFKGSEFYLDIRSGANNYHVYFAHFLDSFVNVLGDFDKGSISSILKRDTETTAIVREEDMSDIVNPAHPKTVPDQVVVTGMLEQSGAVASIAYRGVGSAMDGIGLRWIITGTEGEIQVTGPETQWQFGSPDRSLQVKSGHQTEARNIDFQSESDGFDVNQLPELARNTARILDAFSKGDTSQFSNFEGALKTHRLLDEIINKSGFLNTLQ